PAVAGNIYFDASIGQITKCDKTVVVATIPDAINGISVTSIGKEAFKDCTSLSRITLSDNILSIGEYAFYNCSGLSSIAIPDSVLNIGYSAFEGCSSLSNIMIPDSIAAIQTRTFYGCTTLKSITVPDSVISVGLGAFCYCRSLADIYYSGSEAQWNNISIDYDNVREGWPVVTRVEPGNSALQSATIHYNSTGADTSAPTNILTKDYLYDTSDPGENVILDTDRLNTVSNTSTAASAVQSQVQSMTSEQKASATGADLATLYAETAAAKASSQTMNSGDILINAALLSDIQNTATQAVEAVETALTDGGIVTAREFFRTAILTTTETAVNIRIDPDVLHTEVDKVRVETPAYALTFKLSDLEPDLTHVLSFTAETANPAARTVANEVSITLPEGGTTNSVTVSLPSDSDDPTYQTVASTDGTAAASKYNPATTNMDGKINQSGTYTVITNEKDFTDIGDKSQEMQDAIRYLASKGIIAGRTATTFAPDGSITRAEIATLLVKALGKFDPNAVATFSDVSRRNWYYSAAASSQRHGLINGFPDNTFQGAANINKIQIVAVSSRVLTKEMRYKTPSNPSAYLSKYSDSVAKWAQPEVALATRENLVVYRTDGTFSGDKDMTRGDAAIIIYRLFQRIW
ncbi:MAG: leucine-rich repeat protein, partial [Lachnospiraceae bacterium]|nr:leucine-rich repeat protein [Lachnospiraceae bacterium]